LIQIVAAPSDRYPIGSLITATPFRRERANTQLTIDRSRAPRGSSSRQRLDFPPAAARGSVRRPLAGHSERKQRCDRRAVIPERRARNGNGTEGGGRATADAAGRTKSANNTKSVRSESTSGVQFSPIVGCLSRARTHIFAPAGLPRSSEHEPSTNHARARARACR